MNDEAAFVAAIAAAPGDQHLPLIFADWLDDHGDPRGQWLRNYYVRQWMPPTYENPVPKLLESLRKDKRVTEVRRAAAVIGEPIVPGLIELLKHEKERVRQQACMCLRNIGKRAKDAVPALLAALSDSDGYVREQAAKALKDIGTRDVTDTNQLKEALTDTNWSVRRAASTLLGSMKAKGSVLQELVEKFDSPDLGDRLEVIEGLVQLGTANVVPTLDQALDDPEVEVREKAVEALGRLRFPAAVPALCKAMKDKVARVRKTATEQFGGYSWKVMPTPESVAALTKLLDDKVPDVRAAACAALSINSELAAHLVPRVIKLLGDLSSEVQRNAIHTLSVIARGDKAALSALIAELANPDTEHRRAAVGAVGAVGGDDPGAIAALVPLLADPVEDVSYMAMSTLGERPKLPAEIAPALLARLTRARLVDQWGHASSSALAVLGRIEAPPSTVIETLRASVRNPPQQYDRATALEALASLGPAAVSAVPDIIALFRTTDENQYYHTYQTAVKALVRIGALNELAQLLDETNSNANGNALWYILQATRELGADALPLLPALLRLYHRVGDDTSRRQHVVEAIRYLGPGAAAALPDLMSVLEGDGWAPGRVNILPTLREFGAALVPHLPRLAELSRRSEFAPHLSAFAEVFASFAPDEPVAREPLRELLHRAAPHETNDWNWRWSSKAARQICASALLRFKDESLVPDLVPLVTDPETDVRRDLVNQLDRFHAPAVLPLLRQALDDVDDDIRLRAIEALAHRADSSEETLAALVRAVEDRTAKVRRAAIDALNKLNTSTDEILAALATATEDTDKKVAERAGIALRKLTPKEPKVKPAKAKKAPPAAKPKKEPAPTKGKKKPG